jgi:hypothetical protein
MEQKDLKVASPLVDYAKLNPAGVGTDKSISSAREEILGSTDEYIKALEERYSQPNWYKVAAGFAKPQLGGFLASLGSASEALGENYEQQRAIQPTIAQLRLQNAVGKEGLAQRTKAQQMLDEAVAKTGGLTSEDVANIRKFHPETGEIAQQKFTNQGSTFAQVLQAYQEGASYLKLVKDYGKPFVDSIWPSLQNLVPGKPIPTTGASAVNGVTAAPSSPVTPTGDQKPPRPLGVPESMLSGITKSQELATTSAQIDDRLKDVAKQQEYYANQSKTALPIYNVASELYKLGAHDYMKPAFGVFEKGDPLGILGTALEQQNVSGILQGMREQIIKSRMNSSDKKSAMSDLQSMELALGNLQTQIQSGVINPTDVRTLFESKSVPGLKNTQDSFLRGVANIGHDALGRYEANTVFNQFLNRKDADIKNWQQSPEYTKLQNMLKNRGQQVMSQPAGSEPPKFLTNGLEQSYKHTNEPTQSSGSKRMSVAEHRRIANQQP